MIPFQEIFLRLYSIEVVKCCDIIDHVSPSGFSWNWKRESTDTETLHQLLQLYVEFWNIDCVSHFPFGFRCMLNMEGRYIVKAMKMLVDSVSITHNGPLVCWSNLIPPKVCCFVWRVAMGRIPVTISLVARGVIVPHTFYPLCNKELESQITSLLSDYVKEVYVWIFKWCWIQYRNFSNVLEFLDYAASWGNFP